MKRLFLVSFFILLFCFSVNARAKYQGIVQKGGKLIKTSVSTSYKLNETYPGSTVTVYKVGTTTLATIYSNNSGNIKSNPFTASSSDASYFFYADNGRYDVKFSGTGITSPYTMGDVILSDLAEPYLVTNFGAVCNGATDTFVSITAAVNAIAATNLPGKLQLPQGLACVVSSMIIPSSVIIDYTQGGRFGVVNGHILTIQGAELGQELRNQTYVLLGSGIVSYNGNKTKTVVYPENWGDSLTNISVSTNAAIAALATISNSGGKVSFASRDYIFTGTIFLGDSLGGAFTSISLEGTGVRGTNLIWNGATNLPFFKVSRGRSNYVHDASITNNVARGSTVAFLETGPAVSMQTHGFVTERLIINGFFKGIESGDATIGSGVGSAAELGKFSRIDFLNNTYGFYANSNFNSLSYKFDHCQFALGNYGIYSVTAYNITVEGGEGVANTIADIFITNPGNSLVLHGWDGESGKQFIVSGNGASVIINGGVSLRGYHPASGDALIVLSGAGGYSVGHSIHGVISRPSAMSSGISGPQFIDSVGGPFIDIENCTISNIDVFKNTGTYNFYDGGSAGTSFRIKAVQVIDNSSGAFLYNLKDDDGVIENISRSSTRTMEGNQGFNYLRRVPQHNLNLVRGISATSTQANNFRGQYTFVGGDAGVKIITFKRTVSDAVTNAQGDVVLTSATAVFNVWDLGRRVVVGKAGPNPIVSISESGNTLGATATATINSSGVVTGITITNGGAGFTGTPTVIITDPYGYGSGATATATVVAGVVTNIAVGAGGTNYGFLVTPISIFTNSTTVNLGATFFTAVSGATLVIGQDETDANYILIVTGSANETFKVTSKSTTGFTITSSNNTSTATIDWILVR